MWFNDCFMKGTNFKLTTVFLSRFTIITVHSLHLTHGSANTNTIIFKRYGHENVKVRDVMYVLHGGVKAKLKQIKTFILIFSIIIKISKFSPIFPLS